MAFIGVLLVFLIIFVSIAIVLAIGIAPVVIGTILYNKTDHKKSGIVLKIFGYILLIPSLAFAALMIYSIFPVFHRS